MRPELFLTVATDPVPARRYRRRIVGCGVLLAAVVAVIGAPLYLRSVERDLERRVPEHLSVTGLTGVSASFSGQDGTIRCAAPLADPEGARDLAYEVRGVRTIDLDRSCRVTSAPDVGSVASTTTTTTAGDAATTTTSDETASDEATSDEAASGARRDADAVTADGASPAFDTVGELIRSSPRLSILSSLVSEANLASLVDGDDEITFLAPDDDAFVALTADVLAELRTEPDVLAEVLRRHVVDAAVPLDQLAVGLSDDGLASLQGEPIEVGQSAGAVTVDDAVVTDGDLVAGNGVVHVIDRVLLPADLPLRALAESPEVVAVLDAGGFDLAGAVAEESTLDDLIDAAAANLDPSNVTHTIEVVSDGGVGGPAATVLADLVAVAPLVLTSGTVGVEGSEVFVRGTVVDADARAVLDEIAAGAEVVFDLVDRPVTSADDAEALTDELNTVVAGSPIEFQPASAELSPGAAATLDLLAGLAKQSAGHIVTIEGHTDTDGSASSNLALSDLRAAAVRHELAVRGVPVDQLDHRGLGDASPVIVDGVEDKVASRRVEFVVTVPG